MSDNNLGDWLMADSWQDYRQQRAIRELGSELTSLNSSLAAQRRESGQLRSQLAKLQGTLEERVNRLTRAFDAFVELSDLRMTLAMFDPPALIRHRARQILADPAGAPMLGDFADVPGYWLAPALRVHLAGLRGEQDATALADALDRDPVRSTLFLAIARPGTEVSERWLAQALGSLSPGEPLTHAQRVLWIAAADGTFGDGGRTLLEARLTDLVKALPPDQEQAWSQRAGLTAADSPHASAARLSALRALCAESRGPLLTDSAVKGPPPNSEQLGEVLRDLVDEGSVEEAPLIRRAGELRAVIENRAEPAGPAWDAPAGGAAELLLSDAFEPGTGVRGELARSAGARWIVAAAEVLAGRAAADPPEETSLTVARVTVQVRPNSENTNARALVRAEIERRYAEQSGLPVLTIALAAVGVLLCLAVFAWPNGLAVVAVLVGIGLLIAAGVRWQRARRAVAERQAAREGELQHAERQIEKAAATLATQRTRAEESAKQAAEDLKALRAALE